MVDRHAFAHVLTNLLTNAAKFSPSGAPVVVAASRDPDEVVLSVTDEGPGLPLDEQERVFERFYRSGEPGRRGAGLGLAIARAYAEALGGRIWVESEPGHGATFAVALPEQTAPARGLTSHTARTKLDQPV
jgi:signal transduction histidine kinase